MLQSTHLSVGQDVKDLFAQTYHEDKYGVMKIIFQEDELKVGSSKEFQRSCDQDIESVVLPLLEDDACCFILYRLDHPGNQDYLWVFLSWFPTQSSIREKMEYGSSSENLKEEFGKGFIFHAFSAATKDEVVGGFGGILADWQKRN